MTYAEYLAHEAASSSKHEYLDGEVYVWGDTEEGRIAASDDPGLHDALSLAIGAELRAASSGRSCRVFSSTAIATPDGGVIVPDICVVCGPLVVDGDAIANPAVVIDVLASATATYIRSTKAKHYWRIPSLREYILVSQRGVLIEVYRRNDRGCFEVAVLASPGEQVELLGCGDPITLDVDAIYRDPLA